MKSAVIAWIAMVVLGTTAATSSTIGLFFEPGCSKCSTTLAPGAETTLYINAVRDWDAEFPLVYAEFRVVGLPAGWSATCTPNPEAFFVIGDPFGVGIRISFVNNTLLGECINLVTCNVAATSVATDVYLTVVHHQTEPNGWCYPPAPVITCEPGRGGPPECVLCIRAESQAIINGPECSVAVQPNHWSGVKSLYR